MALARRWRELVTAQIDEKHGFDADRVLQCGYDAFYGNGTPRNLRKAVRCYRAAAQAGHPYAWTNIALCYRYGDGVRTSSKRFFECAVRGAALGHDDAKRLVACALIDGSGVKRTRRAGIEMLRRLARGGDGEACEALCSRLLADHAVRDKRPVLSLLRRGAEHGSAGCMNLLGDWLIFHAASPREQRVAVEWFRRAALRNHVHALHWMSECYRDGRGVKKNDGRAVRWLQRAIEANRSAQRSHEEVSLEAWRDFGRRLLEGQGVRRNRLRGVELIRRAARRGEKGALRVLRELSRKAPRRSSTHGSAR